MSHISDQKKHNAYKSISQVAQILVCLSEDKNTVSDVAKYCGLSKPTASRLLKALEKSNITIRDGTHPKYYLGPLLSQIVANPIIAHLNLITSSIGEMNRLSEKFGETIALGILIGIQHIKLHTIQSTHKIRVHEDDTISSIIPQLQGAATKVVLSELNQKELASIMNNIKLEKITENSITDLGEFRKQINQAKRQGYAISHGEKITGALAISVPVKGYQFPAVLSILGVESRLEPKLPEVLTEILASAKIISSNISEQH